MADEQDPRPIPVDVARSIGFEYRQSIVIVLGFNEHQSYATTWGRKAEDKVQAKAWSDDIMLHMSCHPLPREQLEQSFEDFRDAAQTALKVDELTQQLAEKKTKLPESYEDIVAGLARLPMSWFPGLLISVAEAAYEKGVFRPGGASRTIQKLEAQLGET